MFPVWQCFGIVDRNMILDIPHFRPVSFIGKALPKMRMLSNPVFYISVGRLLTKCYTILLLYVWRQLSIFYLMYLKWHILVVYSSLWLSACYTRFLDAILVLTDVENWNIGYMVDIGYLQYWVNSSRLGYLRDKFCRAGIWRYDIEEGAGE